MRLFLPVIQRANVELEAKVQAEGQQSVQIDTNMVNVSEARDSGEAKLEVKKEDTFVEATRENFHSAPTIELEFATGDFDDTPIARIEDDHGDNDAGIAEFATASEM